MTNEQYIYKKLDWLNKSVLYLLANGGGGGGSVSTVFGRSGAVTAQANDYTFAQIGSTPTTLAGYGITDAASSTNTVRQGGNSFGTTMTIGTNDNFGMAFELNNVVRATLTGAGFNAESGLNTNTINAINGASTLTVGPTGAFGIDFRTSNVVRTKLATDGSLSFDNTASASGVSLYNTSDQVTNYERLRMYWSGNILNIRNEQGGSGSNRAIVLVANGSSISVGNTGNGGFINIDRGASSSSFSTAGITGAYTNSSGINNGISSLNTFNQSGTAGYRSLWISPYEQATGSGAKLLIDAGTNSAANGGGTHTSKFSVSNTGEIFSDGLAEYTDNTAAKAALGNRNGVLYRTGDLVKITHA